MHLKPNAPAAAAAGPSVIGFNLIQGREVEGDLGMIESRSAVDRRDLVGIFPDSGEKDVARAARAAAEALPAWSAAPAAERRALADRTAVLLDRHRERLARIVIREIGMTVPEAQAEVEEAIQACRTFAAEAAARDLPPAPGRVRRPVGVCGILATGSSPLSAPLRKILPALLDGNTVVWKPSDNAPTAAYLLLRAFLEAGLPAGVVNTVNGRGRAGCGKHVLAGLEKGLFQAFSFVGSPTLGAVVAERCGRHLLPADLDLTGKGALLVLPDADLDQAAAGALRAAFGQAGQAPVGLSNLLVHEACAPALRQRLLDGLSALVAGNPLADPAVAMGPLMNARLAAAFREQVEAARQEGAVLAAGGEVWTEANRTDRVRGDLGHGAYLQPCLWEGVTPALAQFRSQVPGPFLNLCPVRDFEEGLAWMAMAPGRAASLYTADVACAGRFFRESRADLVGLNRPAGSPALRRSLTGQGTSPGLRSALDGFSRWQVIEGDPLPAPPEEAPIPLPAGTWTTDWDRL